MSFLENLVNSDQGLECLYFISEDRLASWRVRLAALSAIKTQRSQDAHFHASPERLRRFMVPGIDNTCAHMFSCALVSRRYLARRTGGRSSYAWARFPLIQGLAHVLESCVPGVRQTDACGFPYIYGKVVFRSKYAVSRRRPAGKAPVVDR